MEQAHSSPPPTTSRSWMHWVVYLYIWTTLPVSALLIVAGVLFSLVALFQRLLLSPPYTLLSGYWPVALVWTLFLPFFLSSYGLWRRWPWAIRFSEVFWLVLLYLEGIFLLVFLLMMCGGKVKFYGGGIFWAPLWSFAWYRYFRWFRYPS